MKEIFISTTKEEKIQYDYLKKASTFFAVDFHPDIKNYIPKKCFGMLKLILDSFNKLPSDSEFKEGYDEMPYDLIDAYSEEYLNIKCDIKYSIMFKVDYVDLDYINNVYFSNINTWNDLKKLENNFLPLPSILKKAIDIEDIDLVQKYLITLDF